MELIKELSTLIPNLKESDYKEDFIQVLDVLINLPNEGGITIYELLNQIQKLKQEIE